LIPRAKVTETAVGEPWDVDAQQLDYLNAGQCQSLEEAASRRSVPGVVESWKELLLNFEKVKAGLTCA
jgi:hypothetical protein